LQYPVRPLISPRKLDRFWLEFPRLIPWLRGAEDAGIEVFGSAEGVYFEAGQRLRAGGGHLPEGWDKKPGDLL
jgi:hypothetical protein